ncbi:hypothetical protein CQW23_27952 [Capsicum baccatum]|uniref:Uncharacterized protein n=1 Tax=Capsicum baccatum TaxID=33114 RepID=A0A2G2VF43_CAPBA|nr:hypothetical protein CQW23_27952 [Capsicum baccatum]
MAASNMYDVALKPRLLRSLLKEYVPDLKHQFRNPPVLSYVVSAIKTHQLLSESAPLESDEKLIENWTATVDSWVNRVVALASSDTSRTFKFDRECGAVALPSNDAVMPNYLHFGCVVFGPKDLLALF